MKNTVKPSVKNTRKHSDQLVSPAVKPRPKNARTSSHDAEISSSTSTYSGFRCNHIEVDMETHVVGYHIEFVGSNELVRMTLDGSTMLNVQKAWEALSNHGFMGTRQDIAEFINDDTLRRSIPRVRVTKIGGWVNTLLVTRHGTFGPKSKVADVQFRSEFQQFKKAERRGTWKQYRMLSRPLLRASPELRFAYIVGLAPPLASYIGGRSSFSLCYSANSTSGKTTAIAFSAGQSTFAINDAELIKFGDTSGYLMSSLHEFSGTLAGFNDIKNAREKGPELAAKMQTMSFAAASNSIRRGINSSRDARSAVIVEYDRARIDRAFTILNFAAEKPLADLFGHSELEGGDRARLIEIPFRPASEGGVWANVPQGERHIYVDLMNRFLATQCGTVTPRWARYLRKQDASELNDAVVRWEKEFTDRLIGLEPLQQRIGKSFALLAATARTANEAKLLPLPLESFLEAIETMFERSIGQEKARRIEQLKFSSSILTMLIGKRGRLPKLKVGVAPKEPEQCSCGFRRREKRGCVAYVHVETFEQSLKPALQPHAVRLLETLKMNCGVRGNSSGNKPVAQSGLPRRRYLQLDCKAISALQKGLIAELGELGE